MADVHIQNDRGGSATWVWAVIAIILLAVLAWVIFGGGIPKSGDGDINVDVNVPAQSGGPSQTST